MTRNNEILQTIEANRIPVLPFELTLAKRAFEGHVQEQAHLSERQFEAMNQSSETWHDNAPAEAIAQASKALSALASHTMRIMSQSDVFEYEASVEDGVTLGSLVAVRYGSSSDTTHFYITGATREVTEEIEAALPEVEDLEIITVSSPVGKALLGAKSGETTDFLAPNGRSIPLHVESVDQISVTLPSEE